MTSVRIAGIEDIDRISLVLAASWRTAYRGIIEDSYLDSLRDNHWIEFLTHGLSSDAIFSTVLQDEQEIIGAAILGKSENEGEVHLFSLYLLPDKIGRGHGHVFYSEIEKEMIARGFTLCVLDVLANNKRALNFYERHGFADTNTETPAVLGDQSYTCKVLTKALSQATAGLI